MEIIINGAHAALKKGTSFEYVAENRMFSGSDGYTLSITFPLRGCPRNIEIFGHINRADAAAGKIIFDCEIRCGSFKKFGTIVITEIDEVEVKTQFLEGRSEQNFDETFDKIFINELQLGSGEDVDDSTPAAAWHPLTSDFKCVALPWVNDATGNIQNLADYIVDDATQGTGHYQWNAECYARSWQPYLLYLTRAICQAVGYDADLTAWEERDEYKYLLVCNALPAAWNAENFATALPRWSVAEYFEKLELFLGGEFEIDHRARTVEFNFTTDALDEIPPVSLQRVLDEHSVEVTAEDGKCEYQGAKNFVYKECSHPMWKFYSCEWFMRDWRAGALRYDTVAELLADNQAQRTWKGYTHRGEVDNVNGMLYAADIDTYFIIRAVSKTLIEERGGTMPNKYQYNMQLRPVNILGPHVADQSEDADEVEIEFVPAWIDDTEDKYGPCLFLSFSSYDDNEATGISIRRDPYEAKKESDNSMAQPFAMKALAYGEPQQKTEYYDRIYVAWWDGAAPANGKLPHPHAEDIEIADDWSSCRHLHFSLRLAGKYAQSQRKYRAINAKVKKTFKFLSDTIPNPRAIFFIKGKKYMCEKITATFNEEGMSQLMKGIFYLIED